MTGSSGPQKKTSSDKKFSYFETAPSRFRGKIQGTPEIGLADTPKKGVSNFRKTQDVADTKKAKPAAKPIPKKAASKKQTAGEKMADKLMEKYNTPRGVDPKHLRGTPHK